MKDFQWLNVYECEHRELIPLSSSHDYGTTLERFCQFRIESQLEKKEKAYLLDVCARTIAMETIDAFHPNNTQIINSPLAIPELTSLPARPIVSFQYNNFY